jgi:hypothetical protein
MLAKPNHHSFLTGEKTSSSRPGFLCAFLFLSEWQKKRQRYDDKNVALEKQLKAKLDLDAIMKLIVCQYLIPPFTLSNSRKFLLQTLWLDDGHSLLLNQSLLSSIWSLITN